MLSWERRKVLRTPGTTADSKNYRLVTRLTPMFKASMDYKIAMTLRRYERIEECPSFHLHNTYETGEMVDWICAIGYLTRYIRSSEDSHLDPIICNRDIS